MEIEPQQVIVLLSGRGRTWTQVSWFQIQGHYALFILWQKKLMSWWILKLYYVFACVWVYVCECVCVCVCVKVKCEDNSLLQKQPHMRKQRMQFLTVHVQQILHRRWVKLQGRLQHSGMIMSSVSWKKLRVSTWRCGLIAWGWCCTAQGWSSTLWAGHG